MLTISGVGRAFLSSAKIVSHLIEFEIKVFGKLEGGFVFVSRVACTPQQER